MRYSALSLATAFAVATLFAFGSQQAAANHPVLLEGNNAGETPGATTVPPGSAGDYDGDGLVGTAEDTDNATDRVFGTLNAALAQANGGANHNGHVIIVTSGRFNEIVTLPTGPALNGVTIIEAAPGVQANIDAVLQGDAGNGTRQAGVGITVNSPDTDRIVILRNIAVRNYQVGLQVMGNSRVVCEDCRFDSNVVANVSVSGNARLTLTGCDVRGGGMRFNPARATPSPGDGVAFSGTASGVIDGCTIASNFAAGVRNGSSGTVQLIRSVVFDNTPNLSGRVVTTP